MADTKHEEYPQELVPKFERAKKLEKLTVAYILSVVVLMYLVMGQSQAMKTAWADDMLGLIAPSSFLLATRFFQKPSTREFPYGYHRVATIAYLCGSLALALLGSYLFVDAVVKLLSGERPSIGIISVFGHPVWLGYLMVLALVWSTVPSYFLGKAKEPLADELHDKILYADAATNKADWMMGSATIVGILGIGLGWWWADAAVAGILSVDIATDGFTHLKQAVFDLMNQVPKTVSHQKEDPVLKQLERYFAELDWVADVRIRLREEGHIFYGEAFIITKDTSNILDKLKVTTAQALRLDWRLKDLVLAVVEKLPE